jgi:uncharacterized protein DUF6498
MIRALPILSRVVGLAANMIPLIGVLYWQWDTFQLLMLYWTETLILAFWTLLRLSRLSRDECGTLKINGRPTQATPLGLVGFFGLHAGAFILAHLLFLWLMFSTEWLKTIHGVGDFFYGLYVAHGLWIGLLMMFVTHLVGFLVTPKPVAPQSTADKKAFDPVGAIVAALYVRIVIMQIAVIAGAWYSGFTGSMAPLVIVIALKSLADLAWSGRNPSLKGVTVTTQSGRGPKTTIEM